MRARDTDAIPLPSRPGIEQYKKRAKALVDTIQSRDPARPAVGHSPGWNPLPSMSARKAFESARLPKKSTGS